MVIMVDRRNQNNKGAKICDFGKYFTEIMRRAGYMKASDIVRVQFGIIVRIK